MRLRARVDKNQNEIIYALRGVGATVLLLHQLGGGCPDIAVGYKNETYLLEIKSKGGRLTQDERYFFDWWRGHAIVVYNVDEALRAIGAKYD